MVLLFRMFQNIQMLILIILTMNGRRMMMRSFPQMNFPTVILIGALMKLNPYFLSSHCQIRITIASSKLTKKTSKLLEKVTLYYLLYIPFLVSLELNISILVFTLRPRKPLDIDKIRQMKDPKLAVHMGQVGFQKRGFSTTIIYLERSVNFHILFDLYGPLIS